VIDVWKNRIWYCSKIGFDNSTSFWREKPALCTRAVFQLWHNRTSAQGYKLWVHSNVWSISCSTRTNRQSAWLLAIIVHWHHFETLGPELNIVLQHLAEIYAKTSNFVSATNYIEIKFGHTSIMFCMCNKLHWDEIRSYRYNVYANATVTSSNTAK
jgi:hypothetical protein